MLNSQNDYMIHLQLWKMQRKCRTMSKNIVYAFNLISTNALLKLTQLATTLLICDSSKKVLLIIL